jgi:hypothetical protein
MVAKVKGRFAGAQGALEIAEDPTQSSAQITMRRSGSRSR